MKDWEDRARRAVSWEATPGDRGYFCVKDADGPLLQGEVERGRREIHVMGDDPLVVDKEFGPLIFWPIRVTADIDTCEWVIERLHGDGDDWREAARIPGQMASDYEDDQ